MAQFVVIAGTSATGKSTFMPKLYERITETGYHVEKILEPGPLRDFIKSYRTRDDRNPWEEAALFAADRLMNYTMNVIPRINEEGLVFLSERSLVDTLVNQGLMGGVDLEFIMKQNARITLPDLTLCLTVDGQEGYRRACERFRNGGEPVTTREHPESIDNLTKYYKQSVIAFPQLKIEMIDTTNITNNQTLDLCYEKISRVLR
ncbi:MAG: hypothetical protein M1165_02275 [Candidatus Pacearchaeota archaeon]|nr:hypothetical protein [Candidatus Pacearchaeota archaeon]